MAIVRSLRRFQSRFFSSSSQAATEISKLISGSNIEQPGSSSAASFTSERPVRRKVSTADRKSMLESFVNKYREMNTGKFPSATYARKEVGGSYYVIKKMLQEIENDSRTASVEKGLIKDHKKQSEGENTISMEISTVSSGSQEVSKSQVNSLLRLCKDPRTLDDVDWKEVLYPPPSDVDPLDFRRDTTPDEVKEVLLEIECDRKESKDWKKMIEGENARDLELSIESSESQEVSNTSVQQHCKDPWAVSSFDNIELKDVLQPSTINADTGRTIVRRDDTYDIESDMKGCHGKVEQKPEGKLIDESLLEEKFVFEDLQSKVESQHNGIRKVATENHHTVAQCYEKLEQKPKGESPLEDKSVHEDSQSKVEGKQPDGIINIATEDCDTEGQCHGKVEQKPEDRLIDESLLEEKIVFEDIQSKGELYHDGIRNINRDRPEQQKDDQLREKPSLWGNLKSLATDFINMWKK
uniref:uncharacterized protein LOC122584954 n=1 Tax=Erigeron canadensis TaxID=72917 RepID=UPI001CB8E0B1|nr:uncharacterized protein LOC122584954 [Erigeron canadensis]